MYSATLNGNNKIYLYKFLTQNENEMEYYLSHPDRNVRLILTKFRLSEHKLLIETGRNLKIPIYTQYIFLKSQYGCIWPSVNGWFGFMVFNVTYNNISVILWRSVLLVEETGENHRPVASHWQTLSSTSCHEQGSNSQR